MDEGAADGGGAARGANVAEGGRARGRGNGKGAANGERSGGCGMGGASTAAAGEGALAAPAGAAGGVTLAPSTPTATTIAAATTQPVSAALQSSSTAAKLIQQAAANSTGSDIAQQVLSAMQTGGAQIDVIDKAQFAKKYGRAAGVFDPATNRISLPSDVAADPERLRLILLHEGVHWLQDNVQGGAEALGGPLGQALQGAGAIKKTTPGTKGDSQHDEAQAYLIEALIANQLGVRDRGLGVGASGKALGYDQILANVRATPEYA